MFAEKGTLVLLMNIAMLGVAASIIDSHTLHSCAALPVNTPWSDKWVTHPSKGVEV